MDANPVTENKIPATVATRGSGTPSVWTKTGKIGSTAMTARLLVHRSRPTVLRTGEPRK
jgi:hypothetical protein